MCLALCCVSPVSPCALFFLSNSTIRVTWCSSRGFNCLRPLFNVKQGNQREFPPPPQSTFSNLSWKQIFLNHFCKRIKKNILHWSTVIGLVYNTETWASFCFFWSPFCTLPGSVDLCLLQLCGVPEWDNRELVLPSNLSKFEKMVSYDQKPSGHSAPQMWSLQHSALAGVYYYLALF